jgi:hypothetical protein
MRTLALLGGILAAFFAARWVLQVCGAVMLEWADAGAGEEVPPADHPYLPNGGTKLVPQHLVELQGEFLAPLPLDDRFYRTIPQVNGTLLGRRKDNTHDREPASDGSNAPN